MNADRLNSILAPIAEGMLTPEFVTRLHLSKVTIERAARFRHKYDVGDLSRDLDVPFPVAHLLMNFMGAILAEERLVQILAQNQILYSEASH